MVLEIAIIGHPNEGKSSVLSTLAEDDSVGVSPNPGETARCRTFPVIIDGRELLRFTDTPGFQHPKKILSKLHTFKGRSSEKLIQLRSYTAESKELRHDHELLTPIMRGAGIIFVVDGSRRVYSFDRQEMEIMRQIGKPKMAVINCKNDDHRFLEDWKDELGKHFNSSRRFNAHRATYAERIELLESLKAIDQDWRPLFSEIIDALKKDWESRARTSAAIICSLLSKSLSFQLSLSVKDETERIRREKSLVSQYSNKVMALEQESQQQIRVLFKHTVFNFQLPPHSILKEDLFNKKTWQMLGLTRWQLAVIGGISGGAAGFGIDMLALGHSFGLGTALGTVTGTVSPFIGGRKLYSRPSIMGVKIAGAKILVGPAGKIDLLFVLLNRSLLFYKHTIKRAHGKRDHGEIVTDEDNTNSKGFTRTWKPNHLKVCHSFFKAVLKKDSKARMTAEKQLQEIIFSALMEIARDDQANE